MTIPIIRRAQPWDREELVAMRVALWPESSAEEQASEVDAWLHRGASGTLPLEILVAVDSSGESTHQTGPSRWRRPVITRSARRMVEGASPIP